jgi:ATP-dependent exoDNAse (exonuclease V) alpha subunit
MGFSNAPAMRRLELHRDRLCDSSIANRCEMIVSRLVECQAGRVGRTMNEMLAAGSVTAHAPAARLNVTVLLLLLAAFAMVGFGFRGFTSSARKRIGRKSADENRREQYEIEKMDEKQDERYAEMTPKQREDDYVHPTLFKRIVRFWRN